MRLRVEHTETDAVDGAEAVGGKFRTTPITSTIQQVKQLPQSGKRLSTSASAFRIAFQSIESGLFVKNIFATGCLCQQLSGGT